jgi:hypothetical protein
MGGGMTLVGRNGRKEKSSKPSGDRETTARDSPDDRRPVEAVGSNYAWEQVIGSFAPSLIITLTFIISGERPREDKE